MGFNCPCFCKSKVALKISLLSSSKNIVKALGIHSQVQRKVGLALTIPMAGSSVLFQRPPASLASAQALAFCLATEVILWSWRACSKP